MEKLRNIKVFRVADNGEEEATIVRLTPEAAQDRIDRLWWTGLNLLTTSLSEADQHWNWNRIAQKYSKNALCACVAVLSAKDYVEGAMAYQFNAASKLKPGTGSVYVSRLASAPINRTWLVSHPEY